ncbi:MAG TPA: peptidyl-prolyl cis-trans isomerase [Xanthobacteraceae bacterium]|nr:peptidyl-prolyl cis-trans isomerase [Xanthobacteraceae bacterium]
MLRGIRKASANWLGRAVMGVVMGLLAASFAIWGINDIFRGFGRSTLAKIGGTEIGIEQFRATYNERMRQIERQLGHPLAPEQASAIGLDRQVLGAMVGDAALDQRARQMRLGLSDDAVVKNITGNKAFQTSPGKFDRLRFEQVLRDNGYSEQRFVSEHRRLLLRRQIADSLNGQLPVPNAWLAAINQLQNQERSIEYVRLGPAQAGDIPQPTADELGKYFEARKILFRAPEYRKIETLTVTPAEISKWMEISDADIKAAYDAHNGKYATPERRHVEQMVFPTMQEADAASARLKDGLSFSALAGERGLKEADLDLGTITKSDIVDPAVADAAFALKEGEVSAPVQGRFGAVIVTVPKVEPAAVKSFAEVTPQIRSDIAAERAKAEVRDLHDKIEDERASGASLEQAAQKLKLPVASYDVDRSGRDPDGKLVALPHSGQVISAAFASDVGVDSEPIEADGGYIWYNVAGVTPARDRSLDEVKDKVEQQWREDQVAARLKSKAVDLLDKLKGGAEFETLAKADGLKLETADKLKRQAGAGAGLPPKVIVAIFHTAKDGFGGAEGDQPSQWIVFRVTGVTDPKLDAGSPELKRLEETVQRQASDDIMEQYVASLESDLGLSVNQAALAQALGNSAPDNY